MTIRILTEGQELSFRDLVARLADRGVETDDPLLEEAANVLEWLLSVIWLHENNPGESA